MTRNSTRLPQSGQRIRPPAAVLPADDERFNDAVNGLLRDGAEQREARARVKAAEDILAARQQFEAVLALSRGGADPTRRAESRTRRSRAAKPIGGSG